MIHDRVDGDELPLTQEFRQQMVGSGARGCPRDRSDDGLIWYSPASPFSTSVRSWNRRATGWWQTPAHMQERASLALCLAPVLAARSRMRNNPVG
jgi:hypothetical protein